MSGVRSVRIIRGDKRYKSRNTPTGLGFAGNCPSITLSERWGNGSVGDVFLNGVCDVFGGVGPHQIVVESGAIPDGLTIDTETYEENPGDWVFELYGFPTTAGSYTFTVGGEDANGCPITPKEFTIQIVAQFTLTNQTIVVGANNFLIPVSGLQSPGYTAGQLVSVEYNITGTVEDLEVYFFTPDGMYTTYSQFAAPYGGAAITGASLVGTVFYNSGITVYPSIEGSSAPYTGTWLDDYGGGSFDAQLAGYADVMNGNWTLFIFNNGVGSYTLNSVTLTFAF